MNSKNVVTSTIKYHVSVRSDAIESTLAHRALNSLFLPERLVDEGTQGQSLERCCAGRDVLHDRSGEMCNEGRLQRLVRGGCLLVECAENGSVVVELGMISVGLRVEGRTSC